jgi:tetratricopeptide (TPR) repeat protein
MLNKINISPEKQKLIIYIILILATLAVFWQVNQYDFVNLDDHVYVTENSHIKSGITLEGFRWAFFTTDADYLWHPLIWLSFMCDYQFHGLNAGGYHVTNLILHIMSALLLFWLFNRMTGAIWRSAFVAALFALHPFHVESVAWISERKDVLSAFFWMLTLCLYVYYTEKPVIKRYLLVVFSFVLALMSKPMVVTLPVIMILLDYWPLGRFESKESNCILWQLKEKTPFFVLSAFFSFITIYTQYNPSINDFTLSSRIANASVSFVIYLEKTFWPYDLAVFYPFPYQISLWQVSGAIFLILVISAAVMIALRRLPCLFVGWLWFSITLLPVIGIIRSGDQAMADRYHYLPSIGVAVMLAWGIPLLIIREDARKKILFMAATVFLIILAVLTRNQCGYWKNSSELWNHALHVTKDNYLAHSHLGIILCEKGKIKESFYHFNEAIRLKPDYIEAYNNRGKAYSKLGQYQLAIEDFNKAISMKKYSINAYNNRGVIYGRLGQYQLAIEDFNKVIAVKPDYAYAYYNRGIIYAKIGRYQLAIEDYNKAIAIEPDYVDAYNNRGIAYCVFGRYRRAVEDFNEAIRLKPDYASSYNNRGTVYLDQGIKKLGCYDAQKACALGDCEILKIARSKGNCR